MYKILVTLLLISIFLTACEYSTPEMKAELVRAQSDAVIAERVTNAKIQRDNEAHALAMQIENAKKADAVNAAKVTEYANAYAVAASRVLAVAALFFATVGFSAGAVGAGVGVAKKAVLYGNLVFPNKQMQFPIRNYRAISTDGHKRLFAQHMGTGDVMRLDATKPADEQMIAGLFQTMLHNIGNDGAVGVAKNGGRARDVSYIDPKHILPPANDENIVRRFDAILETFENGEGDNAI